MGMDLMFTLCLLIYAVAVSIKDSLIQMFYICIEFSINSLKPTP